VSRQPPQSYTLNPTPQNLKPWQKYRRRQRGRGQRCRGSATPTLSRPRRAALRSLHFSIYGQLLHRNVQRFRGGLVFKAHRLFNSLESRLESNKEEEEEERRTAVSRQRYADAFDAQTRRTEVAASSLLLSSLELGDRQVYAP